MSLFEVVIWGGSGLFGVGFVAGSLCTLRVMRRLHREQIARLFNDMKVVLSHE
jgi:hypothetical protein